jgi:hypothetical protein
MAATHPNKPIRRFDVFAEYSRLERLDKGDPADQAKGYGIWLAKVVAARKFGRTSDHHDGDQSHAHKPGPKPKFRSLDDEPQTDATFDHDVIDRMGHTFYTQVFAPAIEDAKKSGKSYEDIRDTIRQDWKPARTTRRKQTHTTS